MKMKNFFLKKIEGDELDAKLASEAHTMYLPPAVARGDQSYWSSLEQRIMARVLDPAFVAGLESPHWWNVLDGWSRTGLLAAGIALAVSAALLQNQSTEDPGVEYEAVASMPAIDALAPSVDQSDAVMTYVLAR
jgi:hypothetical protein